MSQYIHQKMDTEYASCVNVAHWKIWVVMDVMNLDRKGPFSDGQFTASEEQGQHTPRCS